MQVYGGYGFIEEYPMAQLLRDCRITMIYEGTNGIQAMDLLGRKLGMKKGMAFMAFLGEVQQVIDRAKKTKGLESLAGKLEATLGAFGEVAMHLGKTAMSPDVKTAFSLASPFLEVAGDIVMAWMLLWRATVAAPKLEKLVGGLEGEERAAKTAKNKNAAFYEGQVRTAEYFITSILPVTGGRMDAIQATNSAAVDIPEVSFGG